MQISFFEEFPTKRNLNKIDLIKWPTKLYLAADSLKKFNKLKSNIKNKNLKRVIYWPILRNNEGYWLSPFSKRKALDRIFKELEKSNTPVMLDLELPTRRNPFLYLTQSLNFIKNKSLIKEFLKKYKGEIYLAEYYPEGGAREKILSGLGLHYNNKKIKIIKMLYHSMHNFNNKFIVDELKRGKREFKNNFLVAYGTIAKGIERNEPSLSKGQLKEDLNLAKKEKINEVVFYRLGGLRKNHIKVMNSFVKP